MLDIAVTMNGVSINDPSRAFIFTAAVTQYLVRVQQPAFTFTAAVVQYLVKVTGT
jgi:hypothetical protein